MGWKVSGKEQCTNYFDFTLVGFLDVKSGKIDVVGRPQIERSSRKRNSPSLRPLLGLVFACIMNRNECSVIGKNVIFKTFMNIWRTVDCMRKGYRQIGKPTFDLRQALDRLFGANFCPLATFQRCPVKVRNLWGQLPKNIPVGNVWEFDKPILKHGMERVKALNISGRISQQLAAVPAFSVSSARNSSIAVMVFSSHKPNSCVSDGMIVTWLKICLKFNTLSIWQWCPLHYLVRQHCVRWLM